MSPASVPLAGLDALRCAIADVMLPERLMSIATGPGGGHRGSSTSPHIDEDQDAVRIAALVDLARHGDAEAFGALYDHYHPSVYRFLYYRLSSQPAAEDLLSETFFKALRSITSFQWQGKDFGAWLMTIARNLLVDHYKAARTRLEMTTDDLTACEEPQEGPEDEVISRLTNEVLRKALASLPAEQQDCLVLRFLSGQSIAETALALGRTEGAIKQLQLRAVRNMAKLMPEGVR